MSACNSRLPALDKEKASVPLPEPEKEKAVDFSNADIDGLEMGIFEAVNAERARNDVRPLKWDPRVNAVARGHSEEIAGTFAKHKSESGATFYDRLNNAGIIYLTAGENIYKSGTLNAGSDVVKEAIGGWLTSPGHKSILLDIDNLYSHGAVGIACKPAECFVTLDVIGAEKRNDDLLLNAGYGTFVTLYDPAWDFGDNITVKVEMTATVPIEVMVVIDEAQWSNYLKQNYEGIESIYKGNRVSSINRTFNIKKGYGMILFNNNFPGSLVKLLVDYTA